MLNGIIFDMDGVIVDSHTAHKKAWRSFLASLSRDVSDADLDFVLDGRKKEDILVHFLGPLSREDEARYGHLKEQLFYDHAADVNVIEGLHEFVTELRSRGIKTAVASCGSKSRVHFILELLKIHDSFSAIVTGDDVPRGKPDPAIFLRAAEMIGCEPGQSLVIEDAVAGVIGAKAAGMKCLAIASNGRARALQEAGADRIVTDFTSVCVDELQKLFEHGAAQAATAK